MNTFLNKISILPYREAFQAQLYFDEIEQIPMGLTLLMLRGNPIMIGRIKRLNQHPEAITLMVQQRMCIPFTSRKTHYK